MQIPKDSRGGYTNIRQNRLLIKEGDKRQRTLYINKNFNRERRYSNYKHLCTKIIKICETKIDRIKGRNR